jgi:hypothetical protein
MATYTPQAAEDAVAVDGDRGVPVLGVRNDSASSKTSTDGDYSMLATDAAGRIGVADLGGSVTVDGQVAASHSTDELRAGTTSYTPKFAVISASTSGDNTVVSLVSSKKIRVLRLTVVASAAVNVKFRSSTTTDKTGLHYLAANGGWVEAFCPVGIFETAAGEALTINLSGNVAVGGSLTYIEV